MMSTAEELPPVELDPISPKGPFGAVTPRIWTRPLVKGPPGPCGCGCAHTRETTRGFDAIEWIETKLRVALMPWQKWVLIHALEIVLVHGVMRYRFSKVVLLVGRQSGKSTLAAMLVAWKISTGQIDLAVGAAQTIDIARETWDRACAMLEESPLTRHLVERQYRANGQQRVLMTNRCEYKVVAATRKGGRGLSAGHLGFDEIREQTNWEAWGALSKITNAQPDPQKWMITNAGEDDSVVLNHFVALGRNAVMEAADEHETALPEEGTGPPEDDDEDEGELGFFEYSAPDGCELDDVEAWKQATPALGWRIRLSTLKSDLRDDPPNIFRTEVLCQSVPTLNNALDEQAWTAGADPRRPSLAGLRGKLCLGLEVSPTFGHTVLVAVAGPGYASLNERRFVAEVVQAWENFDEARLTLPELVRSINPINVSYFRSGPTLALKLDVESHFVVSQISEPSAACMGLAEVVSSRRLIHAGEPLLTAHVLAAQKQKTADGWKFGRPDGGDTTAAYALAAAVHAARALPERRPMRRAGVRG